MKVEGYLFLGCAVVFGGADYVYWYFSHDPTGSTALAIAVGLAFLTGFYVLFTGRRLPRRPEDDPWGWGNSLEWATSCPPPRHNFTSIPRIRSERPAFELHHPNIKSGRPAREPISSGQ